MESTVLPWGNGASTPGSPPTDTTSTSDGRTGFAGAALPRPRGADSAVAAGATESMTTVRALIADPDPASRTALADALTRGGLGTVDQVSDAAEAVSRVTDEPRGELLLVSLAFGPATVQVILAARAAGWSRVVSLAPTAEIGSVIDAVGAGAHGVLIGRRANPAASNLPTTIHDLSAREIEVLHLVADGRSNKWIGDALTLSALTVKSHLARIGRKLGTGDRAHMVALALRAGVIS